MQKNGHTIITLAVVSFVLSIGLGSTPAGAALTLATTFGTNYPIPYRTATPSLMVVKGAGTNDVYVLEADPATGALPVSGSFSLANDTNYGVVGANTLRGAAQIGNATGAADFNFGTAGAQTLRTAAIIGNALGQAAFDAGATSAQTLRVVLANDQTIPISAVALPLPSGASTAARQDTGNTSLASIDTKTPALVGGRQPVDGSGVTQPISAVALPLPSGASTAAKQPALGTAGTASADVITVQGIASMTPLLTNGSGSTQPVSMASVVSTANSSTTPLGGGGVFTGTGEEVKDYGVVTIEVFTNVASATDGLSVQWSPDNTNWDDTDVFTIAANNGRFFTFGPEARYFRIVYTNGAGAQATFRMQTIFHYGYLKPSTHRLNETLNDENDAELVKSADTLRVSANNYVVKAGDANGNEFSTLRVAGNPVDYNSGAAGAQTLRSVLATRHEAAATPISVRVSNGSAFTPAVRTYADSARNAYASTSVTTGAWVQLIASTAAEINAMTLFDSSGQTLELGTGAAAAETRKLIIPPGGIDGQFGINIPAGTRVSVRAVSATASVGELTLTGFN